MSIYAPVPGAHDAFRTASSALALSGLIASGDQRPEVLATIEKGEAWLLDALKTLRRAEGTTTYNNWGHAYALRALSSLAGREGVTTEKLALYKKTAQHQVEMLVRFQDIDGGCGYLHQDSITRRPSGGSMSFTTSTVLLAMHEAREVLGVTLPEKRIQQALRSIRQQRVPDFAYVYAMEHRFYTREPINRPGGSLARSQVCNAATRQWGDEAVTDEVIVEWLDRLIKRNGWLDMARKRTRPHDSHFANSGYFYYYGHYYASECIHLLPNGQQNEWKDKLARVLVRKQEKDGAWWDYPLYDYHKAYGTGYALTTLSRCRK